MLIKQAVPSQSRALLPKQGSRGGKGRGEEEEGSRKRKSSFFKSKLQGGVRGEAVILRRVGKWRVRASRGRWVAQRDYQCRWIASLPYTCRPSHNERLRCSPLLLWHFSVFIQLMLITKELKMRWTSTAKNNIYLGEGFQLKTWTKGLFYLCICILVVKSNYVQFKYDCHILWRMNVWFRHKTETHLKNMFLTNHINSNQLQLKEHCFPIMLWWQVYKVQDLVKVWERTLFRLNVNERFFTSHC